MRKRQGVKLPVEVGKLCQIPSMLLIAQGLLSLVLKLQYQHVKMGYCLIVHSSRLSWLSGMTQNQISVDEKPCQCLQTLQIQGDTPLYLLERATSSVWFKHYSVRGLESSSHLCSSQWSANPMTVMCLLRVRCGWGMIVHKGHGYRNSCPFPSASVSSKHRKGKIFSPMRAPCLPPSASLLCLGSWVWHPEFRICQAIPINCLSVHHHFCFEPRSSCIAQAGLEVMVLLLQHPKQLGLQGHISACQNRIL